MKKIAISLIALGVIASGALASQRNIDPVDYTFTVSNGVVDSKPLAAVAATSTGSAFEALFVRSMDRQNGDDNR
jgi:hypothetical protein